MTTTWTCIADPANKWVSGGESRAELPASEYVADTTACIFQFSTCQPFTATKTDDGHVWRPHVGADLVAFVAANYDPGTTCEIDD